MLELEDFLVYPLDFVGRYDPAVAARGTRHAKKMRSSDGVSPETARPPQTNQQGRWLAPLPIGVLVTAFSVGGHLWDLRN